MKKHVLIAAFTLLALTSPSASGQHTGQLILSITTPITIAAATTEFLLSLALLKENSDATGNLPDKHQANQASTAQWVGYVATSAAVIEFIMATTLFVSNLQSKDKISMRLVLLYTVPWLVNVVAQGVQLSTLNLLCDNQTPCWDDTSCSADKTCKPAPSFQTTYDAWIIIKSITAIAPLVSMFSVKWLRNNAPF